MSQNVLVIIKYVSLTERGVTQPMSTANRTRTKQEIPVINTDDGYFDCEEPIQEIQW